MTRLLDRLPERMLDPAQAPNDWLLRRLRAAEDLDTRRRLRALERRAAGGWEPETEELDELPDDPSETRPGKRYKIKGGDSQPDRIVEAIQFADDTMGWFEPDMVPWYRAMGSNIVMDDVTGAIDYGMKASTITGTNSVLSSAVGAVMRITTNGSNNDVRGYLTSARTIFLRLWLADAVALVGAMEGSLADIRYWVGFFDGSPNAADTATLLHCAGFRFSTGTADANWQCVTNDGGATATITDSGVPCAVASLYRLRVRLLPAAVEFYIDDSLVATHTTDLPGSSQPMGFDARVTALTASAKDFYFGRLDVRQR